MPSTRRTFFTQLAAGTAGLGLALVARPALAGGSLFSAINEFRARADRSPLRADRRAVTEAQRHARRMAQAGRTMTHPDPYGIEAERRWGLVREVNGAGESIEDLLARAQQHGRSRQSLLDRYDAMAVGVSEGQAGTVFAAVFLFRTADCAR